MLSNCEIIQVINKAKEIITRKQKLKMFAKNRK